MGWLDWAKIVGGIVAAPVTGGASLALTAQGIGGAMSNASAARQQNRQVTDANNLTRYQVDQKAAIERALADLQQRRYLQESRGTNADQALRGGYLQGVEDVTVKPPPGVNMGQISGGLRPSAFLNRGQVGKELERQALLDLMSPEGQASDPRFAAAKSVGGNVVGGSGRALPSLDVGPLPEPEKAGKWDKFLSVAGPALSAYGSIAGSMGGGGGGGASSGASMPDLDYYSSLVQPRQLTSGIRF